jgi:branched-chain amino acid transport system permease protein
MGYAGIISLSHAVFFGSGGYITGILLTKLGVSLLPSLIISMVVAGIFGGIFMLIIGRVRGDYLVVVTLGLQMVFISILINWREVTGGAIGLMGIPRPAFLGYQLDSAVSYGILSLIICGIVVAIAWWISRSPFGRSLKAIRENEQGAQSLGKNVFRGKLTVFAVSSALAGAAGSLYAPFQQYINPISFSLWQSIMALVIVVVGGAGSYWGSIIGAFILVSLPEALRFIPITSGITAQIRELVFGFALLMVLFFRPQGILGEYSFGAVRMPPGGKEKEKGLAQFQDQVLLSCINNASKKEWEASQQGVTLQVKNLSKHFGGIEAIRDLSFELKRGEIVGVIGANGAGKSTLFNLVCGFTKPDKGTVFFKGQNITGNKPHENARLGIGRSFQNLHIFSRLSVLDNIIVALQTPDDENLVHVFSPKTILRDRQHRQFALQFLEAVGLADKGSDLAENLSYADQKLVILARLLAMKSELLLLDELAAGLDPESMGSLASLLRKIPSTGVDVCLVEHSLDFVRQTVDKILFLDQGQVIAEGPIEKIAQDPKLTQIYFGSLA